MKKLLITLPQGEMMDTFILPEALDMLKEHYEVTVNSFSRQFTPQEMYELGKDASVIVSGWGTPSLKSAGFITEENKLELLVHTGGSLGDMVDGDTYKKGIRTVSGNKLFAKSTAEGALAYILMALRSIPETVDSTRGGTWRCALTKGLIGKSVGIIGVGAVARCLISYLKPFNVSLKLFDSNYKIDEAYLAENNAVQTSLEDVLSTCDIISLHAALNEGTKGMLTQREFSLIKDGALFVNTARGRIIDEIGLTEELKKGRFSAVLDVFYTEPLPEDHCLRRLSNVYVMPHQAGPAYDMRGYIGYEVARDAVSYLYGKPLEYEILPADAARMTVQK